MPVSYTHLDVYKRQNKGFLCNFSFLFCFQLFSSQNLFWQIVFLINWDRLYLKCYKKFLFSWSLREIPLFASFSYLFLHHTYNVKSLFLHPMLNMRRYRKETLWVWLIGSYYIYDTRRTVENRFCFIYYWLITSKRVLLFC